MSDMIDDLEVEDVTAAELDGAPFPSGRIPTAHTSLEDADGKPDAFGDDSTAAPVGVVDSVLEQSEGSDIPVTYEEAAKAFGGNSAGNEFNNSSISPDQPVANDTSAEALTGEKAEEPKKAATRNMGGRKMSGGMKPATKPETVAKTEKEEKSAE